MEYKKLHVLGQLHGSTIKEVARNAGITISTLRQWIREYKAEYAEDRARRGLPGTPAQWEPKKGK